MLYGLSASNALPKNRLKDKQTNRQLVVFFVPLMPLTGNPNLFIMSCLRFLRICQ